MENKVGKIWTPEQRGQPFISCWPHHHEFGFQNCPLVVLRSICDKYEQQHSGPHGSSSSLYIVMCCMPDTSSSHLHGACIQITDWGIFLIQDMVELQTSIRGDPIWERVVRWEHTSRASCMPYWLMCFSPPQCSPVQDGLNTDHQPYRLSLHYIISSPQKLLIWDVFQLVTLTGKVPDPMLCILGIPCLINKYLHFRELSIYFGNFTSPCWKNRDELG